MSHRLRLLLVTGLLLVLGVVFGLIMQNVWLGLVIAAVVWLVWFLGFESRRGGNSGVYDDDDRGIEL